MKILIAPDSYKGSISSMNAAKAIERGLHAGGVNCDCHLFPLADGGEGTLSVIQTLQKGDLIEETVPNALGKPLKASRGKYDEGRLAIIELAQASGLAGLKEKQPLKASTFGTGIQIKNALEEGANEIILTLGGSATVDGGTGIISALGGRFWDKRGKEISPDSNLLFHMHKVDLGHLNERFFKTRWLLLADVENPVFGENGGIRVYGPQKGLSYMEIEDLEKKMGRWSQFLTQKTEIVKTPGSGAAGAAALPFLAKTHVQMENGFSWIRRTFGLDRMMDDCDILITGEGQLDLQTTMGKGPGQLAKMAREKGRKTIAIVGRQTIDTSLFDHVISLQQYSNDAWKLMKKPDWFIEKAAKDLVKLLNTF